MRVLLVSHHAPPHIGGLDLLVDKEVRALAAAGHSVVLVTSDLGGQGQVPDYPPSVRVIRVPAWHFLERRYHLPYPIFSPRLLSVLWREAGQCDVVHVHGFIFMSSVFGLVVASLRGRPCMLTDHGGIQRYSSSIFTVLARIAAETLGRLTSRLANRLVAYNSRVLRVLERLAGTKKKSLFLPYPVDLKLFHPPTPGQRRQARERLGWSAGRPKVLFVGRLIADKGVPLLLGAVDPAYDIAFCGPGDPAILGNLPRAGVEFLPPRPQAEVVSLYHAADLLALPSSREGFPLVVREALSCGLRVVMSYEEGYEPYRHLPGLAFSKHDSSAFRQTMLRALGEANPLLPDPHMPEYKEFCPSEETWVRRLYGGVSKSQVTHDK